MPTPPKADGRPSNSPGADDPQQANSVPKHFKSRLVKTWRGVEPKLRFMLSGDRSRWLPMRLWLHIALFFGLAVAALFLLWAIFKGMFSPSLDDPLKVEVIRLILFTIAGIGGVFALVIAYRRQGLNEAAEVRTERAEAREDGKVFNERFKSAAEQLSSERAANRLAGVYAMAGLADDWDAGRQTCINVLCAYLRMPYGPPNDFAGLESRDDDAAAEARKENKERRQEQQVRHTIVDVIGERLRTEPVQGKTWHGHRFDFTQAHLDGGNLLGIKVIGGSMVFQEAEFSGGRVFFGLAEFSGGNVFFGWARFSGGNVDFNSAKFSRGKVDFTGAEFSGGRVDFSLAKFSGAHVDFTSAKFSGGRVDFSEASVWESPPIFSPGSKHLQPGLLLPLPPLEPDADDGSQQAF